AEADLRQGAALNVGDWFQFEVGTGSLIANSAVRLPVTAVIGATTWVTFHVDLVGTDVRMTGQPEEVPPLARGVIPEVEQRGYRAYPLVDHVADKIAATYERHGDTQMPSTRYRDLVDLVSIAVSASVRAEALRTALLSEFERRGLPVPDVFDIPDRALWVPGYAAEARRSLLKTGQTLDEALAIVRLLIDPVLNDTAAGVWDRDRREWSVRGGT
ncbi:MAG TPA: nucleotidyl transferase AbiEii/AbiGii toxin family protein, partial [Nocardioidaceae bacterium]|nr:nucleotidyl transferase AbiEii/AbiGii toxin family protein [Nocardioidaceae bacterium]